MKEDVMAVVKIVPTKLMNAVKCHMQIANFNNTRQVFKVDQT
jgi:hypothetical protein